MKLADNLSNGNEQSSFRTSISRAYYSVFLMARHRIETNFGKFNLVRKGDIHDAIINKLKALKLGHIADKLDDLRRMRIKADYFVDVLVDQNHAKKSLMLARYIHTEIQQAL